MRSCQAKLFCETRILVFLVCILVTTEYSRNHLVGSLRTFLFGVHKVGVYVLVHFAYRRTSVVKIGVVSIDKLKSKHSLLLIDFECLCVIVT